ncbi:hypothetical protein TWF481_005929 [Arthrobotrys musiformis]|uniref:Uncharacterized protein n=1 Tax=Arthrobotrys musiformis TaxID=47236 RepID=A0AAV9WF79_9PEZI
MNLSAIWAVKREIIYNFYKFLSYSRITTAESAPVVSRDVFVGTIQKPLQLQLLEVFLKSEKSTFDLDGVRTLLDPKSLSEIANQVHKCTVRMALETAKVLEGDGVQGPLLMPAVLLVAGYGTPSTIMENDPRLDSNLDTERQKHYSLIMAHHPLTKSLKKEVGHRVAIEPVENA